MPLIWVEDNASRAATIYRLGKKATSTYVKSFKLFGSANDLEVHTDVKLKIQQSLDYWQYPGQPKNKLRAESYSLSFLGDNCWQLTINYEKDGAEDEQKPDPLRRSRAFDTGGATQHITQAKKERVYGDGPPMQKAIGVDGDNVAGVDVVVPQLQWSEQYDVPTNYVSSAYIRKLSWLTGTVNKSTFRTFAAGEVLFMGCSGSQEWDSDKGNGPWNLTYKFAASPNAGGSSPTIPALTVGNISGIQKKGHEYLWVRYTDGVGDSMLLKRPRAVYVDEVYREEEFSQLGIGVA